MMRYDYCFAHCNREERRKCKHECEGYTEHADDPVERSFRDMETFYSLLDKTGLYFPFDQGGRIRVFEKVAAKFADTSSFTRGHECLLLWVYSLGKLPADWPERFNVYLPERALIIRWNHDFPWFREHKEQAITAGLDSMLEALYEGVPLEDIIV